MEFRLYPGLLLCAATALVVTGFTQRQPENMRTALLVLKAAPGSAEAVALQAVCGVLLGAPDKALTLLKAVARCGCL